MSGCGRARWHVRLECSRFQGGDNSGTTKRPVHSPIPEDHKLSFTQHARTYQERVPESKRNCSSEYKKKIDTAKAINSLHTMATKLRVFDCIEEKRSEVNGGPFTIGSSAACDMRLKGASGASEWVRISRNGDGYHVVADDPGQSLFLDGQVGASGIIDTSGEHTLVIKGHPIALYLGGQEGEEWLQAVNPKEWWVFQKDIGEWNGPVQAWEISLIADGSSRFITQCRGMSNMGFYAMHVADKLAEGRDMGAFSGEEPAPMATEPEVSGIDMEYGEFTCPVCWLKFDRGDLMNIAVHASFRGDPILGEEHMQRFLAKSVQRPGAGPGCHGATVAGVGMPTLSEEITTRIHRRTPLHFLDCGRPHFREVILPQRLDKGAPESFVPRIRYELPRCLPFGKCRPQRHETPPLRSRKPTGCLPREDRPRRSSLRAASSPRTTGDVAQTLRFPSIR